MKNRTINKRYIPLLLLFAMLGYSQDKGEIHIPLSHPDQAGSIAIRLKKGSIHVVGSDRKDVLIRFSKQESPNEMREYEIQVEQEKGRKTPPGMKRITNSKVDLEVSEKENRIQVENAGFNNYIVLEVEVPFRFDVGLKTYSGERLHVQDITGKVTMESDFGGAIKAEGITGTVNALTYSGAIEIEFLAIPDPADMTFRNYSGTIDLTLPPSYRANMLMKTSQGDIFSSFDLVVDDSENQLKEDEASENFRVFTDSWIHAKLNGGGKQLKIKSELGPIYLRSNTD